MTYIEWMRPRIREFHRVLKPTGSFYYHCDWHASHYVKVELDRVFGFGNFRNEIVWHYSGWNKLLKDKFESRHDVLLFYTNGAHPIFNSYATPWANAEEYVKTRKQKVRHDETGKAYVLSDAGGGKRVKRYLEEAMQAQRPVDDVWDIPKLNNSSKERRGYPTQKPLALLQRVIQASSNEGGIVLDAFCGCGTTMEAAALQNRQWIGIDFSPTACRVIAKRLEDRLGLKEGLNFTLRDMPKTAEQLRRMPHFEFENWAVVALGGIPNKVKVGDYGIDGRLYLADVIKEHRGDFFETLDRWYPIQVKQIDHVGRPEIDQFETAMRRDKRLKGYFIAFGFTGGATKEIQRANTQDGLDIVPVTVDEILRHELAIA